ncbi:MAG: hypothetical protein ACI952_002722 [Flavobacteriales bacterium]|jgi:uncharacterized protein YdcH (DUF465 family)
MQDTHFSRLFKNYHTLNKEVNRIKFGVESTSAAYLEKHQILQVVKNIVEMKMYVQTNH